MNKQDNPPSDDIYAERIFIDGVPIDGTATYGFGYGAGNQISEVTGNTSFLGVAVPKNQRCHPIPFDTSGMYLTGLAEQSTIEFTFRIFIEVFPNTSNEALLVLATDSPPFDPLALEIYSRVITELPPCVPVYMNASGKWWQKVARVIANVAPIAGNALNTVLPGAGMAGNAVQFLANKLADIKVDEKQIKKQINKLADNDKTGMIMRYKPVQRKTVPSPNARKKNKKKQQPKRQAFPIIHNCDEETFEDETLEALSPDSYNDIACEQCGVVMNDNRELCTLHIFKEGDDCFATICDGNSIWSPRQIKVALRQIFPEDIDGRSVRSKLYVRGEQFGLNETDILNAVLSALPEN